MGGQNAAAGGVRRYVRTRALAEAMVPRRDRQDARVATLRASSRREQISHQTIYALDWSSERTVCRSLESTGSGISSAGEKARSGKKRGAPPTSVSIEGRPAVVDRRSVATVDWEGDTICGRRRTHPAVGGAVTLVERKSGYLLLAKVPNLQAATVRQAAARRYATTPATSAEDPARWTTARNLPNTRRWRWKPRCGLLCPKPYSAWQRGHKREYQRPDPRFL